MFINHIFNVHYVILFTLLALINGKDKYFFGFSGWRQSVVRSHFQAGIKLTLQSFIRIIDFVADFMISETNW